jgi:hypothetical protein
LATTWQPTSYLEGGKKIVEEVKDLPRPTISGQEKLGTFIFPMTAIDPNEQFEVLVRKLIATTN